MICCSNHHQSTIIERIGSSRPSPNQGNRLLHPLRSPSANLPVFPPSVSRGTSPCFSCPFDALDQPLFFISYLFFYFFFPFPWFYYYFDHDYLPPGRTGREPREPRISSTYFIIMKFRWIVRLGNTRTYNSLNDDIAFLSNGGNIAKLLKKFKVVQLIIKSIYKKRQA